jgi:hypothetical protein
MENISAKGQNGQVTFDGDFVTITRKGFFGRMTIGKGEKRIPAGAVTSVQWKPPGAMMNGFIAFSLAGGNETKSRFGSQTVDASKDENAVIVTKNQAAAFAPLREAIERKIAERYKSTTSGAPTAAPDLMEQLRQLAQLRDAGVVSEAEFAAKKADLLNRL